MTTGIKIVGARDLRKALREVDKEAPKAISKVHKAIATRIATDAKRRASSRPRREPMGHIAPTITARGSQTKASIRAGGARAPDIFVQEFGGKVPLFGDQSRRYEVRPRKKDGYFVYPAIKANRPTMERIYLQALERALNRYFDQ